MSGFLVGHGILGLEAFHVWNGVELNHQLANASPHGTVWPLIRLNRITGLHSLPEADDNRAPATGRLGEITYPSYPRGRTITYEGTIYGRDLGELRACERNLRAAFSDRSSSGQMIVKPHPVIGGAQFYFYARPLAFDCDDEQTVGVEAMPSPYQRNFILSLRQADPRYFHGPTVGTGLVAAGATPTVTNAGDAPTDFGLECAGPIPDDFVIERYGNPDARKLLLNNVGLASGDSLIMDFGHRSIRRESDGVDLTGRLVFADSDWWNDGAWGLHPGDTVIRCAGGGQWSASFDSASW